MKWDDKMRRDEMILHEQRLNSIHFICWLKKGDAQRHMHSKQNKTKKQSKPQEIDGYEHSEPTQTNMNKKQQREEEGGREASIAIKHIKQHSTANYHSKEVDNNAEISTQRYQHRDINFL